MKKIIIVLTVGLLLGGCGPRFIQHRKNPAIEGNAILRVYLVRHAEAYKNVLHMPGTPDEKLDSLTSKGQMQAASVGIFLKGKGIVAVITSPTGRTRETADAIGEALGLDQHYSVNNAFVSLKKGIKPDGKSVSLSWRKNSGKRVMTPVLREANLLRMVPIVQQVRLINWQKNTRVKLSRLFPMEISVPLCLARPKILRLPSVTNYMMFRPDPSARSLLLTRDGI